MTCQSLQSVFDPRLENGCQPLQTKCLSEKNSVEHFKSNTNNPGWCWFQLLLWMCM